MLFGMIVLAWGLTLVLPPGEFERVTNEAGREQVLMVKIWLLGSAALVVTVLIGFA